MYFSKSWIHIVLDFGHLLYKKSLLTLSQTKIIKLLSYFKVVKEKKLFLDGKVFSKIVDKYSEISSKFEALGKENKNNTKVEHSDKNSHKRNCAAEFGRKFYVRNNFNVKGILNWEEIIGNLVGGGVNETGLEPEIIYLGNEKKDRYEILRQTEMLNKLNEEYDKFSVNLDYEKVNQNFILQCIANLLFYHNYIDNRCNKDIKETQITNLLMQIFSIIYSKNATYNNVP